MSNDKTYHVTVRLAPGHAFGRRVNDLPGTLRPLDGAAQLTDVPGKPCDFSTLAPD